MIQKSQALADHERYVEGVRRHMERLMDEHQPETPREVMILTELAQVYQDKDEFERDHRLWMRHEVAHAQLMFQRQEAEDFLKLQRQWAKAPAAIAPIIGQSLSGAVWLVEFWQILVARLAPGAIGPVPGMDQACQAMLALGFSDRIQNLTQPGWWWATRFLVIQQDRDLAIAAWLRKSGTCDRATETQQARHKLYDAPDAATARRELYEAAVRQAEMCQARLEQLREAEPALREAQQARARCMGLGTRGLATSLNNAFKLRDAILRSIKWIEERLARVPKEKAETERYNKRMGRMERLMDGFSPPQSAEAPVTAARMATDAGQAVEEAIHTELLPQMAAAGQKRPEPARKAVAHAPQPVHRPMSNRKKALAKIAAKEERARPMAMPAGQNC